MGFYTNATDTIHVVFGNDFNLVVCETCNNCRQVKCVCMCVCMCVYNRQSVFNTAPFRLALHSLLA